MWYSFWNDGSNGPGVLLLPPIWYWAPLTTNYSILVWWYGHFFSLKKKNYFLKHVFNYYSKFVHKSVTILANRNGDELGSDVECNGPWESHTPKGNVLANILSTYKPHFIKRYFWCGTRYDCIICYDDQNYLILQVLALIWSLLLTTST